MAESIPKTIVVTGGVKNIGKDIALYGAKTSFGRAGDKTPEQRDYERAHVAVGYRSQDPSDLRRTENMIKAMQEAGSQAIAIRGDLVIPEEREGFVRAVGGWASKLGGVNVLIMNAAGGLEEEDPAYGNEINNVAQVATVRAMIPHLAPDPTIVLMESSWSELYPELGGPPLANYRRNVSATKKEGRDKTIEVVENEIIPVIGGKALVLAAGIVEGSGLARLMRGGLPEFYEEQAEMGNVVSIKAVSEAALRMIHDPDLPHGHVEWVGTSPEELLEKYPAEAA
jgi:hypothetical protein